MSASQRGRSRAVMTGFIALLFLGPPLATSLAVWWTDYLWFVDIGQRDVFVTTWLSGLATAVIFGVVSFGLIYANLRIARALAPRVVLTAVDPDAPPGLDEFIAQMRATIGPIIDRVVLWGSLVLAVLIGLGMSGQWGTFRLALSDVRFGRTDPMFGMDIGFFVFVLPALRLVADWLLPTLMLVAVLVAIVHLLAGSIQPWAGLKGVSANAKAHLSVVLGFVMVSMAYDYYLRIFELNFSPRGQVIGASYTDVNAQLPGLWALVVISLLVALALLVNIKFKGWRLPIAAVGVWVAASFLLLNIIPSAVQEFRVSPNEIALEAPFIARNIEATRQAFDLVDIEKRPFPATEQLTAADVLANATTLENVRLWDPAIAAQTYRQLQAIRTYYDFRDVDVGRYVIDGEQRQVLVSVREMDVSLLAEQAQTWVNRHLVYTHGHGIVMSPSNEVDGRGLPNFIIRDIPARGADGIALDRPGVYFGEATTDYVIVHTGIPEFAYPVADGRVETRYEGPAGIVLESIAHRVAFALRFSAPQILLSEYIQPESKVLFDREIVTRVSKIAPWLTLDSDPYPAVVDGRIVWVLDGYTTSRHYPYSQFFRGVNYIRNSVKVTVDAYDGTTTLWGFDPDDPILRAWQGIFPGLITPVAEAPPAVAEHFRYPADLFSLQAEVYRTYHMTDPQDFYNKEDAWEFPGEREGNPMQPFFVLMQLPGEDRPVFQMIQPYTPRNRDNMIGWMAVKSDPEYYGRRIVYEFPKERVVLGPQQVHARINQDDVIAPQLTLWSQRGSNVIFGDMIVVPIEDAIVYVQPLYLQAEETAIPELARVLVIYGDKVEMAVDLEAALLAVFGEKPDAPVEEPGGVVVEEPTDALRAQELYDQALAAQRVGDWAEYGRLIDELGRVIAELAGVAGGTPLTPDALEDPVVQ